MITPFPLSSTAMAMAALNRYRAQQIADGKIVGEHLCRLYGATHSRAITDEMNRRGLLHKGVPGFWVGAVLRDQRFVNTGKVVLPPLAPGARSHDPRLIWLWRLAEGGVVPLILWEYAEFCGQTPPPTHNQKVLFILRHVTVKKNSAGLWYGETRWQNDEYLATLRRNLEPHRKWLLLFALLKTMQFKSQTKARAEIKRLVNMFVDSMV